MAELLVGDPVGDASDRPRLERLAKFVVLHDLTQIQFAHPHTPLGQDLHESIAGESFHRDSDRRLAHPESRDELALRDE